MIKDLWERYKSCRGSHVIWLARIQVALGFVGTVAMISFNVLSHTDLSPVLDQKSLLAWMIISGVITEVLRRYKTGDLDEL